MSEKKFRLVKWVDLHPDGRKKVVIQDNLSAQEATNAAVAHVDPDDLAPEIPFIEEEEES